MTKEQVFNQLVREGIFVTNDPKELKFLDELVVEGVTLRRGSLFVTNDRRGKALTIMPGDRVKVFDPRLFKNDCDTPLSVTMQPATVIRRYGMRSTYIYPDLIDVIFDHDGRLSKAHFTEYIHELTS